MLAMPSPATVCKDLQEIWYSPEYLEYFAPSDDEIPVKYQPLPADASLTALSPCHVADFDPLEEDPEEDPEEDLADYPTDEGDNEEEKEDESSKDDDDEEEGEASEEEEYEYLAPANSAALPVIDYVPSADDMKPFKTDGSVATPPPPRSPQTIVPLSMTHLRRARIFVRPYYPPLPSTEALIVEYASAPIPPSPSLLSPLLSPLPRISSPPLLLPPLHTSPTYARASLGYKATMVYDIPEVDMSSQKRLCLTAPASKFEVGESSTAATARQTWHTLANRVDYGFINTLDASI
ncbi:hypothetical protein Tco_1263706 [Tanacetum coccineum]